jgi:CIC family chloride channel protein
MAVLFRVMVLKIEQIRSVLCLQLWSHHHVAGVAVLILLGGGLGAAAAYSTRAFCPEAGGSGIPHVKAVLVSARPMRSFRLIATKLGAGLLALAAGMSLGREGPTVHIGSACGDGFARLFHLPGRTRRALIAAGAGAGLSAAFSAPLAGFLFVMEELRREMSRGTYGNALVTAVAAVGVTRLLLGYDTTFHVTDMQPLHLTAIPVLVIIGLAAAVVGRLFNSALLGAVGKKPPLVWTGAIAGALGGILALTLPQVAGGGNLLTQALLAGDGEVETTRSFLFILLAMKLLFTVLCYASGVPGGIFAPILTMGAILGTFVGAVMQHAMPLWTPSPDRLATIGMAAVLTASVRAPLTGVVLIVEMTGQYHTLYSLLLAAFVAYVASETWGTEPVYEALLGRDLRQNRQWLDGEARVLEVPVEEGSPFDRTRIDKLHVPEDLLVAVVEREGRTLVPHGSTRLEAGDFLTVVAGSSCTDLELSEFLEAARAP